MESLSMFSLAGKRALITGSSRGVGLALAGALAAQRRRPVTAGTMPTDTPLFTVLLAGTVVVVAGLTFFPALALGPIAEALS